MTESKMIPQKPVLEVLTAIQGSLGVENQKVFAKASKQLGSEWAKTVPRAGSVDELMQKIADYFQNELQLAGTVTFERDGQDYVLKIRGCAICHGKLVKDRYGISAACAISLFPVGAAIDNMEIRNARLKEIRKPGPVGECDLVYEIKY